MSGRGLLGLWWKLRFSALAFFFGWEVFIVEPELTLDRRLLLQQLLEDTSGLDEADVHFQPPTGTEMRYPCITYSRGREARRFADNLPYQRVQGYTVTVIHKDPDNDIRDKVAALPYCSFDRWYANDGLNHDVYTLFF